MLRALIVDAAVQYDSPYDGKMYILVLWNAIHAPSMTNNLLPLFMMREAGIDVRDMAKTHAESPTVEDHSITFVETSFRIPLSLWGVFSCFLTSKPTSKTLQNAVDVYIIMPSLWQPHSDTYAHNESKMLEGEGNMRDWKDWEQWVVLDDIPEDTGMASGLHIPMEECSWDKDCPQDEEEQVNNAYWHIPGYCSQVSSVLTSVLTVLDQSVMCALLE